MASKIVEFFGYAPSDRSAEARLARETKACPFVGGTCSKMLRDRSRSGACTLMPARGKPVICCPNRLYAQDYIILKDVAQVAFGPNVELVPGNSVSTSGSSCSEIVKVAVFGKRWGAS